MRLSCLVSLLAVLLGALPALAEAPPETGSPVPVAAPSAAAPAPADATTEPSVDAGVAPAPASLDLAAEVEELKRRVAVLGEELESQRTGSAPVTPKVDERSPVNMSPAASKVYARDGLSVGGYGEAVLQLYDQHLQDGQLKTKNSVADTQRAVVYLGYKYEDWVVFNSEIEFEHSGISDEHPEGEAIIEFAYLDFLLRPWLKVRAGQVLLPVGFINELHEPPIFLGALRPRLESKPGLIPTTWHEMGVGVYGDLPGNLNYRLYLVNGLDSEGFNKGGSGSIRGGRQDGHLAIANNPAVTGRVDWHLVPGALLGASFYAGNSAQERGSTAIWTTVFDAHAEYRSHGFQARALYAHVTNSRAGLEALGSGAEAFGTGTEQNGAYLEAGYDVFTLLPNLNQNLIPFARVEWMNTQQAVASGAVVNLANKQTFVELGFNYRPIPQVAVKAEYDINLNAAELGRNQFALAVGYLF